MGGDSMVPSRWHHVVNSQCHKPSQKSPLCTGVKNRPRMVGLCHWVSHISMDWFKIYKKLWIFRSHGEVPIWRFLEIGVPPVIIHFNWIFPDKPTSCWATSAMAIPSSLQPAAAASGPWPLGPGSSVTSLRGLKPSAIPSYGVPSMWPNTWRSWADLFTPDG